MISSVGLNELCMTEILIIVLVMHVTVILFNGNSTYF